MDFARLFPRLAVLVGLAVVGWLGAGRMTSTSDRDTKEPRSRSLESASGLAEESRGRRDVASKSFGSNPSDSERVTFKSHVKSNVEIPQGLDGLVFFDTRRKRVSLSTYLGKKNIVLVFTEGFSGMLCPFCKTQTSRLVANYKKFEALDTEVLVVYPGARQHLDDFIEAARSSAKGQVDAVPFPILLDEDLRATDYFNIKSNLAHPSTFIIDKEGNTRLAYVGKDMTADRPSVGAILSILESANMGQTARRSDDS